MNTPKVVPPLFRKSEGEKEQAITLANRVLDRTGADPDDDLAVLARQLLRALERLGEYEPPRYSD
jgi:hypothetical protein